MWITIHMGGTSLVRDRYELGTPWIHHRSQASTTSSSRSDGQAGPGKDLERALHGLGRRGLNLRQTAGLTEAAGLRQPRPMKREEVHLLHAGNRRREMGCGLEAGFIVLRRAGFDTGAA